MSAIEAERVARQNPEKATEKDDANSLNSNDKKNPSFTFDDIKDGCNFGINAIPEVDKAEIAQHSADGGHGWEMQLDDPNAKENKGTLFYPFDKGPERFFEEF